jgi:hypothetical protein
VNCETYFRAHCVAFTVKATDWPEAEAADRAADYLAIYVGSLPTAAVRVLHAALLHEQQHPEATPDAAMAEAIRETRDREGRAILFALADWLIRPATGYAVRLCPAGDASEAGE